MISSNTIFNIKIHDDNMLKLKSRIAPHGNVDSTKSELKLGCNMCFPTGVRLIMSVVPLNKWSLAKADVKAALL